MMAGKEKLEVTLRVRVKRTTHNRIKKLARLESMSVSHWVRRQIEGV